MAKKKKSTPKPDPEHAEHIDLSPEEHDSLEAACDRTGARIMREELGLSEQRIRELQARRYTPPPGTGKPAWKRDDPADEA